MEKASWGRRLLGAPRLLGLCPLPLLSSFPSELSLTKRSGLFLAMAWICNLQSRSRCRESRIQVREHRVEELTFTEHLVGTLPSQLRCHPLCEAGVSQLRLTEVTCQVHTQWEAEQVPSPGLSASQGCISTCLLPTHLPPLLTELPLTPKWKGALCS